MEQRQRKTAARALPRGDIYHGRLPLIVGGERKIARCDVVLRSRTRPPAPPSTSTALETAQGELDRQIASYDRTLDRVATAVAIFNRDQQLVFFNEAYARAVEARSRLAEIAPARRRVLDRLRELGRLPEVVNYPDGRQSCSPATRRRRLGGPWHLPDGRMLHVMAEQRPDGGVTYLFADETERLALESRYKALIGVQRETLNSLKEGVAVFGTDGRLKLFNSAFADIWKLSRRALGESRTSTRSSPMRATYDEPQTWARHRARGHRVLRASARRSKAR